MKIAIVPARGGSKRIPRKNVKNFLGKPIIAYSIKAAQDSGVFDKIIVSTDDEEIAEIARSYGAEIPFIRPKEISNDFATIMEVIKHAIEWFDNAGEKVDMACCIYATAPFVQAADIANGLDAFKEDDVMMAFSATSFAFPIQRAIFINDKGRAEMFQPEHLLTRSQDLQEAYHDAAQFIWGRAQAFKDELPAFAPHTKPIIIDRSMAQDIDTIEDWDFAENLYQIKMGKNASNI